MFLGLFVSILKFTFPLEVPSMRTVYFVLSLVSFFFFLLQWSPWTGGENGWAPMFGLLEGLDNKVHHFSIEQHFWTSILAGFTITFLASAVFCGEGEAEEEF